MQAIQLLVGLGNPGSQYDATRHNAGFWFADAIAKQHQAQFRFDAKFSGDYTRLSLSANTLHILKPTTYMNCSGEAVQALCHFYKIPWSACLVIHDELDLPLGCVRLKKGGGHGGHGGLRNIMQHSGNDDFYRLRVGIGHPGHKDRVTGYVLGVPPAEERQHIDHALQEALSYVPDLIEGQFDKVMNALNRKESLVRNEGE